MPRTFRHELLRKALHFGSVVVPIAYAAGVTRASIVLVVAVAALIALGVELARAAHSPSARRFGGAVGVLLRPHELARWTGATWLALGFLLAVVAFPRDVAIAAMWSAGAGDGAASVVGRGVAELRRRPHAGKSLPGSAACLLVSAAGAMLLTGLGVAQALLVGVLAAAAERPVRPFDDNLRIVAVVGAGILLWRMALS